MTPGVLLTKDGREICMASARGRFEYKDRLHRIWERDKHLCCLCGFPLWLSEATWEHKLGRGMGGSKRNDCIHSTFEVKGFTSYINGAAHLLCNQAKGSISFARWKETNPGAF